MKIVNINASKCYNVIIAPGILAESGSYIQRVCGGKMAVIVTDITVNKLYGDTVEESLKGSGYEVFRFVIESGEGSKNTVNYIALLNFLAENSFTRSDIVIALGGGVVGDLAGFAAATYMRGMEFVQIPTTLLAAVDSSVGGKTAIDLAAGKNLAGSFYQPSLVLCDYLTLDSLSSGIFRDGCAEVIKYGMISDLELFKSLKKPIKPQLEQIIHRCICIKRDIVVLDEQDTGPRALLNFGHTLGHALEALSGYGISHGSAVSIGMVLITRACAIIGICGNDVLNELLGMAKSFGLPTTSTFSPYEIFNATLSDKKRSGDYVNLIVPKAIGQCVVRRTPVEELLKIIELGLSDSER